jgi:hypothetical protein
MDDLDGNRVRDRLLDRKIGLASVELTRVGLQSTTGDPRRPILGGASAFAGHVLRSRVR